MSQCDTCDKKFSGRYEFCPGWCAEYEDEPEPGMICQEFKPTPSPKHANDME